MTPCNPVSKRYVYSSRGKNIGGNNKIMDGRNGEMDAMEKHASNVSRSPPGKGHEVIGECIRHDLLRGYLGAVLDKGPCFVSLAAWPCLPSISSIDLSISIYLYLSLSISICLYLSTYLPIYLPIYLSVCLCLSFCLSILLIKVSLNCCASIPSQARHDMS